MPWQDIFIIISILASIITSISLAIWSWFFRSTTGARIFSLLMLATTIWSLFYGMEMLALTLPEIIFWSKMQYFGSTTLLVIWLILVLMYTGQKDWLTPKNIFTLFVLPIISLLLVWSNEYHELIWQNPHVIKVSQLYLLGFTPGKWWWVNIAYAYILYVISIGFLLSGLRRSSQLYRRQISVLLIFSGLSGITSLSYIFGVAPADINLIPMAFSLSGIVIAWGLFRYKFNDLTPIARNAIIETMSEGLLVLDTSKRVIDINPIAQNLIALPENEILGKPVGQVFSNYPQIHNLWESISKEEDTHIDIVLEKANQKARSFDLLISPLCDKKNTIYGWLMLWHDITERKEQELTAKLISDIIYQISTADDFNSSLHEALKLVVEYAGWVLGEAWLPNRDGTLLENSGVSYYIKRDDNHLKEFDEASQDFTFKEGVGLPGRVWVSKKVEWQTNISTLSAEKYLRSQHAINANLKAALGIPVLDKNHVIAVLVFYMDKSRQEDQNMIALISTAAAQLGTVLKNKRAEEVMRIQSAALETTTSGIVITDKTGEITWANPAFVKLTGYSMQEIMGMNPRVLKSGQHPPEFYRQLWEKIASGETWQGEIVNQRKDMSLYIEEQTITPARNKKGEITHFISIKQDITQRREAEKALASERNLLRTLIDNIPDLIYAKDIHKKFSLANLALAKLTGHEDPNELIGRDEFDSAPPDIAKQFIAVEEEIHRTGKPVLNHIEKTVDTQNNQLWLSTTKVPLKDENGEITGIVGVSRDITEQRQAEEELRKLSRAVEQSASTIVITNLKGEIEFTNPAFSEITGYRFEEVVGKRTNVLKSGQHSRDFYQELWHTVTSGEIWQGEMLNRKKNGDLYWEAATISPVHNQEGKITHFIAIKEDITERKAIEKALAEEQEKTDALLRNILPEEVAQEIKETGKAKPVLFENISILFTDFKNFTATAEELSPDELVKLIDYYFTNFDRITEKHHLEKLKTIGDSYMCASGLPSHDPDHAINITNAAFEMLRFVREAKEERQQKGLPFWEIRVGISSGSVVAGVVGQKKYAYDIWGDAVVMAARMEQSGEVDKINISDPTYQLIKDEFTCAYRGRVTAKNKGQVKMYFVDGEKRKRT